MMTQLKVLVKHGDLDQIAKYLKESTIKFEHWEDYAILLKVLRKSDTRTAKLLIESGFRINYERWDQHSTTPLHLAVKLECLDLVKTLLDNGARLDICDEEYRTPLYIATFIVQNESLIDLLLEKVPLKNFMCNSECISGHLHAAAMRNRVDIVKRLIQNGVDINSTTDLESDIYYGYTPLHIAVKFGCKETVEFLMDCDAEISHIYSTWRSSGFTPLHLAFELGNMELVDLLLRHYVLKEPTVDNTMTTNKWSHFHIACARNDVRSVEKFLHLLKIDINTGVAEDKSRDKSVAYEKTPLQVAIAHGCKDVTQLLLQRNAISTEDDAVAAERAFGVKVCELLASKRVDSVESDPQKRPAQYESPTRFHRICHRNSIVDAKNFLRSYKVDVNHRVDPESAYWPGFTALHFVIESGHHCRMSHQASIAGDDLKRQIGPVTPKIPSKREHEEVKEKRETECLVEFLVQQGADMTLPNGLGVSALESAIQDIASDEVPDLGIIHCFLRAAPKQVIPYLNSRGLTRFHMLCGDPATPLSTLESSYDAHILNQAIELEVPMIGGYTPLHLAAVSGSGQTIMWLLDHGADPAAVTPSGESALHLVIERCEEDDPCGLMGNSSLLCRLIVSSNPISRLSGKSQFHLICKTLSPLEIKHALTIGITNVNAKVGSHSVLEPKGDTALHYALRRDEEEDDQYARWLLEHKVDVNVPGRGGDLPLHTGASDEVNYHWYKMLVPPSSINAVNDEGRTPLHELCAVNFLFDNEFYYEPHLKGQGKLWYLLNHGADINICDKKGRTPFRLKLSKGRDDQQSLATLAKHCRKLSLIKMHISEQNQSCYRKCKGFFSEYQYTQICEKEILKMKKTPIGKNLSLYDIIFYNKVRMEKVASNEVLEKKARSSQLESEFPNYGYLIRLKYEEGLRRKALVDRYRPFISVLTGRQLPVECWNLIIDYLTIDDMSILSDA